MSFSGSWWNNRILTASWIRVHSRKFVAKWFLLSGSQRKSAARKILVALCHRVVDVGFATIYSIAMAISRSNRLLRIIAFFKFIKAALLIATGIGALRLVNRNIYEYATDLVARYHLNPGNHFIAHALERTTSITPRQLYGLGILAFVYSVFFLAEGIGLWSLKRWGEWITVVITGSLLPFEIYEIWHRFSLSKTAVLVFNVAIVVYLIMRLKRERSA